MPGKRSVPFPEFKRHLWPDRHKPTKSTSAVHEMPEAAPPPDFGVTYDTYCAEIATMGDTQLNGVLACLESNVRENTIPTALEQVLREAKVSRRAGLENDKIEYLRRNKLLFAEVPKEVNEDKAVVAQGYLVKRARVEAVAQQAEGH